MAQDRELALGDVERLLLEGEDRAVALEEADEVAGRTDGQRPEDVVLGRPLGQGPLPGQPEQRRGVRAKAEPGKRGREREVGQIRFRRYVVTVAS
jgi:hypothetical protein